MVLLLHRSTKAYHTRRGFVPPGHVANKFNACHVISDAAWKARQGKVRKLRIARKILKNIMRPIIIIIIIVFFKRVSCTCALEHTVVFLVPWFGTISARIAIKSCCQNDDILLPRTKRTVHWTTTSRVLTQQLNTKAHYAFKCRLRDITKLQKTVFIRKNNSRWVLVL